MAFAPDGSHLQHPDCSGDALLLGLWRSHDYALRFLFEQCASVGHDVEAAPDRVLREIERVAPAAPRLFEPLLWMRDIASQVLATRAAYAGTILVVLHDILRRVNEAYGARMDAWKAAKPQIEGHSFGVIVWAAGNNFRHFAEWAKANEPDEKQSRSIRVVSDILGLSISANASDHQVRENLCPQVLYVLSDGRFETLAVRTFEFTDSLKGAAARNRRPAPRGRRRTT